MASIVALSASEGSLVGLSGSLVAFVSVEAMEALVGVCTLLEGQRRNLPARLATARAVVFLLIASLASCSLADC